MNKYRNLILLFTALLFLSIQGCNSSNKSDVNTDDPDKAFAIAKRNYDKKDYLQAVEDFSYLKIKFSGTKIIDKAQYYLAMCYYNRKEYILSAYEFENFLKNYPTSEFTVQSRFQLAMCYYGLSPKYNLDQTYSKYAITEFQNFLSLYPTDKLASDADAKIKELRDKLALKLYKSGELYMRMEDYKASIIYYDAVIEDYFDSIWADDALYGKIRALVIKKKYEDVKKEIERFEKKFPTSDLLKSVQKVKNDLPS